MRSSLSHALEGRSYARIRRTARAGRLRIRGCV